MITKQSATEIKETINQESSTIWSKDALLAEKDSLQGKMDKIDELLGETETLEVKSTAEIAVIAEAERVAKLTPEELAKEEALK